MADKNFSAWMGGPLFTKQKKWNNGTQNSGPVGRRRSRGFTKMRAALADAARSHGVVLWCGDQHRNHGTGYRGSYKGEYHG